MTAHGWAVEHHRATAEELHHLEVPTDPGRRLWVLEPTGPAVVLGSTQSTDDVDAAAAETAGVAVARRRSGGGAVWVEPADPVWIDVIVPRDDALWSDDVAQAFLPIGRAWREALAEIGAGAGLSVHDGPMRHTRWSATVCFSGTGPGEVVAAAGAKVVGISQRRTRAAARFQCALHRRWDPEPLRSLLNEPPPAEHLAAAGHGVGPIDVDALVDVLARHLSVG